MRLRWIPACAAIFLTACMTGGGDSGPEVGSLSGDPAEGSWTKVAAIAEATEHFVKDGGFAFLDDTTGYLNIGPDPSTGSYRWLVTLDGGATWEPIPTDSTFSTGSIWSLGNSIGYSQTDFFAYDDRGRKRKQPRAARTSDGGFNWEFVAINGDSILDDFRVQSNGVLWVEGADKQYFSLDTGATWLEFQPQQAVSGELSKAGIFLTDALHGMAAYFGKILRFDLAADKVSEQTPEGITRIQEIGADRTGFTIIGGYRMDMGTGLQTPGLVQSRDGVTWETRLGEGNGFLYASAAWRGQVAMAVGVIGQSGLLSYRTEDAGRTWRKHPAAGLPMALVLSCPSENLCYGFGYPNVLLKYTR